MKFEDGFTQAGPDECWPWLRSRTSAGYGNLRMDGRNYYAHRIAYELAFGPIPEGFCVLHRCDRPWCVNPSHLFLGTKHDNTLDMMSKGRHRSGGKPCNQGEQNGMAKFTIAQVTEIRQLHADGRAQIKILAQRFGVWPDTIRNIINRRTWNHLE